MKAFRLTGLKTLELADVPEPEIKNSADVKIRMKVLGICGSDIHYYTQGNIGSQKVEYPFTIGHEGAGIVTQVGPGVSRVKPGDVIAVEPAMPCYECDQCHAGRHHTCRNLRFLGCPGQSEGCLSEYLVMPETSCFRLPDNLDADHGSISEPLSIGIYSIRRSGSVKDLNIGILGFGPIGMSIMLAAKAESVAKIFVTDKIDERLAIARKEGASLTANPNAEDVTERILSSEPAGLDIVYECCGQQEAIDQALHILKPGGKIVIVGIPEFDYWSLNAEVLRRREISVVSVRRQNDCVETSLELMSTGKIRIDNMITHRFPFSKTKEAFDLVEGYKDGVMKAMIDF